MISRLLIFNYFKVNDIFTVLYMYIYVENTGNAQSNEKVITKIKVAIEYA